MFGTLFLALNLISLLDDYKRRVYYIAEAECNVLQYTVLGQQKIKTHITDLDSGIMEIIIFHASTLSNFRDRVGCTFH